MTRRALITGGAGFIGSHVADRMLGDGWEVEILDDLSTGKRANIPADVRLHEIDVQSSEAANLVRSGRFDTIVHLAAQMDVRKSVADPLFDVDVNVRGTVNITEAMRRARSHARLVFASTGGVLYGDHHMPPNFETTRKEPDSPYAIAKLAGEHYLSYFSRIHGLDYVALRFGNVYGPRQDPHGEAGVVAIFCGRILDGKPVTVFGDGLQTRDYVYVADVVEAIIRAIDVRLAPAAGVDARAYNIGTGTGTSVVDLVDRLRAATDTHVDVELAPKRPGEQQDSFINCDKARDDLGWSPRVGLEAGLRETFAWFASCSRQSSPAAH